MSEDSEEDEAGRWEAENGLYKLQEEEGGARRLLLDGCWEMVRRRHVDPGAEGEGPPRGARPLSWAKCD